MMRIAIFGAIAVALSLMISSPGFAAPSTALGKTCKVASAQLPMARKGQIKDPLALAKAIEASLKEDPSGNGKIKGAHISPNGFLAAIQGAGGKVKGPSALPKYLRSLVAGEMPLGKITMSRVTYTRSKNCNESYALDLKKGFSRSARKGEVGWYDPNTNLLLLAGDCSNSPLSPVTGPKPEQSVVQASETPRQCTGKYEVPTIGLYGWNHHVWDRVSGLRETRDATKTDGGGFDHPNRLSRKHGKAIRGCYKDGECQKSKIKKSFVANYIKTDERGNVQNVQRIWVSPERSSFKGYRRFPAPEILDQKEKWTHIQIYVRTAGALAGELSSPLGGELRVSRKEFIGRKCLKFLHSIDPKPTIP